MIWIVLIIIVISAVVIWQETHCAVVNNSAVLCNVRLNNARRRVSLKPSLGLVVLLFVLACISGLRKEIGGSDYFVYKTVYDSLPKLDIFFSNFSSLRVDYITYGHEVGWLFIMSFIKSLGLNYNGFLFLISLFFYFSFFKLIKCFDVNSYLIILFFLYTTFFYNTMISIRQGTTIAVFMLMVICLFKKKYKTYFLLYIVACCIHTAAVILILPVIIFNCCVKRNTIRNLVIIAFFLLVLAQLHVNILYPFKYLTPVIRTVFGGTVAQKFLDFIGSAGAGNISILHSLQFLLFMWLIYYYNKQIYENRIFAGVANIILLLFIPLILFPQYAILTRIKDYFTIFYGVLLAIILKVEKSSRNRLIILAFCILICTVGYFKYIIEFDDGHFWSYAIGFKLRG